jgi:GTP cyclohydrolase I
MNKRLKLISWEACLAWGKALEYPRGMNVYGVLRGGAILASFLASKGLFRQVYDVREADVIMDDIVDSGATMLRFQKEFPLKPFVSMVKKSIPTDWYIFPWEELEENSADDICLRLLQFIGEDPHRGGLKDTPRRFLAAWREWSSGYGQNPEDIMKTFEDGAEGADQMIVVQDIPVYSHCEHHLAPFFGHAHVAYIPDRKIIGLSKIIRLVDIFARRLQVQERITNQIADALDEHLQPAGVGVIVNCRHLCMESRGVQKRGANTITTALRGAFLTDEKTRSEFMRWR